MSADVIAQAERERIEREIDELEELGALAAGLMKDEPARRFRQQARELRVSLERFANPETKR